MKSSGAKSEKCWTLASNGFVGTYIKVVNAGDVTISIEASGPANADVSVMVGSSNMRLKLTDKPTKHSEKFPLAAGTHFIRIGYRNQPEAKSPVKICTLEVTGATFVNEHSDANALAAAETYIASDRRKPVKIKLDGASPGATAT